MPLCANAQETALLDYTMGGAVLLLLALNVVLLLRQRRYRSAAAAAEKRDAETMHMARLALIGEIAGAVVHEVTEPLSAILTNVEAAELLLLQPSPDLAPIREILADVRKDDLRAHGIVRRLRSLLRKRDLHFASVDLNALVLEVLALIKTDACRRNVTVQALLDPLLPAVPADAVHLQQVLLNLLLNAMDAMSTTPLGERQLAISTGRHGAAFAQIAVSDRGHGIAAEQLERVFDPCFTTKNQDLGLSIARCIVEMHGGQLWAENCQHGGVVCRFTVPLKAV